MKILVITNLYPPQELGGYGRCMSDFVWGLLKNCHKVLVVTSNAPYLSSPTPVGPNNEEVNRNLELKGSFESGLFIESNPSDIRRIDNHNFSLLSDILSSQWDACLLGNIDLLGPSLINFLAEYDIPILHHVGFVSPPYSASEFPSHPRYSIATASECVRDNLLKHGFPLKTAPVIYPGARVDLFDQTIGGLSPCIHHSLSLHDTGYSLGSVSNPLKIGFAGLIMSSKGLHTLVQAVIQLLQSGIHVDVSIAGSVFQRAYFDYLTSMIESHGLQYNFHFFGQLSRERLVRFWSLQQIGVFPSIHPEAFGISAAEIMCSGLVLCSSGVGGASEIFTHSETGFLFKPDSPDSLAQSLMNIVCDISLLSSIPASAYSYASSHFSVNNSVKLIEQHFSLASS